MARIALAVLVYDIVAALDVHRHRPALVNVLEHIHRLLGGAERVAAAHRRLLGVVIRTDVVAPLLQQIGEGENLLPVGIAPKDVREVGECETAAGDKLLREIGRLFLSAHRQVGPCEQRLRRIL